MEKLRPTKSPRDSRPAGSLLSQALVARELEVDHGDRHHLDEAHCFISHALEATWLNLAKSNFQHAREIVDPMLVDADALIPEDLKGPLHAGVEAKGGIVVAEVDWVLIEVTALDEGHHLFQGDRFFQFSNLEEVGNAFFDLIDVGRR